MGYATATQWEASIYAPSPFPANAQQRLDRASAVVDEMLLAAVYDVDEAGNPTNVDDSAAIRDATMAQAEYAGLSGDALSSGAAQYQSVAIGSVRLDRGQTGKTGTTPGRYSPTARGILQRRGLLSNPPYAY